MIQLSIAPVFLLAGVGALLNVFTGRLVRIIDKIDKLDKYEYENSVLMEDKKLQQIIEQRREHQSQLFLKVQNLVKFITLQHCLAMVLPLSTLILLRKLSTSLLLTTFSTRITMRLLMTTMTLFFMA